MTSAATLYAALRQNDEVALEQLYLGIRKRWWVWLNSKAGKQDAEDVLDEALCEVLQAVGRDGLQQTEKLWNWIAPMVRHSAEHWIAQQIVRRERGERTPAETVLAMAEGADHRPNAEQLLLASEELAMRARLMFDAFVTLSNGDQEIVRRFYFLDETRSEIQKSMFLTPTQFRLRKSRAVAAMRVHVERHR